MKQRLRLIFSLLILTALLILPYFVFADTAAPSNAAIKNLNAAALGNGGYQGISLADTIGTVIRAALSLLGVIFIILIIVGGFVWMTAEGNEQKVEKAQNYIRRALIGLIITLSAWAIWSFILQKFIFTA
jgi:lysylphosphatidylglycerol synthetase-like protein (DUF2156 family)